MRIVVLALSVLAVSLNLAMAQRVGGKDAGSVAWTISDIEFRAETRDGKAIHTKGFETMIFVKSGARWHIAHSHSSTRRVRAPRK
ncbi:MAG: nuclear transport factor 2 family protein [Elusimicrobiota bacterium]